MQSGEHHDQATSDQQRVIPGCYNPSEEVAKMNNIKKSYFIKNKTSVNRVDSDSIVSAMEARTRNHRVEF